MCTHPKRHEKTSSVLPRMLFLPRATGFGRESLAPQGLRRILYSWDGFAEGRHDALSALETAPTPAAFRMFFAHALRFNSQRI